MGDRGVAAFNWNTFAIGLLFYDGQMAGSCHKKRQARKKLERRKVCVCQNGKLKTFNRQRAGRGAGRSKQLFGKLNLFTIAAASWPSGKVAVTFDFHRPAFDFHLFALATGLGNRTWQQDFGNRTTLAKAIGNQSNPSQVAPYRPNSLQRPPVFCFRFSVAI